MMPPEAHTQLKTATSSIVHNTARLTAAKLLISLLCIFTLLYPSRSSAQELLIVIKLKEITEDFGVLVTVNVINNRYTGKQDLAIKPTEDTVYETDVFLHTVCAAVATVTAQSPVYETYIDMVMLNINDELWAISTESCRKAFGMATEVGQNAMLKSRLQQLR
jgi:hypothetical protein